MAKKKSVRKDRSKLVGGVAFAGTLALYSLVFKPGLVGLIIGGGLAWLLGWVAKTMATPLKGLDRNAKSRDELQVTIIEDEYARGIVEKGVELLDALKVERDAINEYVFTRRLNELRENFDKLLRNVIDSPDQAHRLRKLNTYYFPTAIKLLQSYRSAKNQGTSYITMAATREDILGMLDRLTDATAKLLDTMLQDDLEDMDIEIDVFDRMLKSDGLAEDEVTEDLRQSAQAAAKEIPMSKAPTVKPTVPVQQAQPAPAPKPVTQPAPAPVQKAAAPTPAPAAPEYRPEGVYLDYEVQAKEAVSTPVPVLTVPAATASARQLQQGAPVLTVPGSPVAPDFADAAKPKENEA